MDGSIISISMDGQVSHVADQPLQDLIDLAVNEITSPSTSSPSSLNNSKYVVLAKPSSPQRSPQKNLLNIWLSPQQTQHAIDLFETQSNIVSQPTEYEFESKRFVFDDHMIRFHSNGKVIAEEGYSIFAPLLSEAIKAHLPYAEYDLIIGQDEVGIGEHIGPLVIGSVAATPQQLVDLQLVGIKDSKMVPRKITGSLVQWIRDIVTTTSIYQLTPLQYNEVKLNQQLSTVDILTYAHNQAVGRIINQLKQIHGLPDNTLYLVDQFDKYERLKYFEQNNTNKLSYRYFPHAEQRSIAVAAASLCAKLARNLWLQKYEKIHEIDLKRKHLNKLRQSSKSHQFLKMV